jgi:hypothetical protein
MSLKLNSSGGGSVTLQEPTTASNVTLNLPAADGTVVYENASGNVGIGTSSPTLTFGKGLVVANAGFATLRLNNTTSSVDSEITSHSTGLLAYTLTNHPVVFGTNGTEKARIDSNGNLLVGTTSFASAGRVTAQSSSASGNIISNNTAGSGTRYHCVFYENGTERGSITSNGSTTSYITTSDYRLKEDVQPMQNALSRVAALKPCTYTWKADGSDGEGFIAHELQAVCPEAVSGEKDAVNEDGSIKPQGIDTSFLVATLTAAIQEQQAMIEELKAKVAALEAQ